MYKKAFELSYKNKKVEIEIQDFVGDVRNINGTKDLFSLSYISDSKDKGQSILVTEADINFYADDYFNIDELKTVGETDIKVKYYEDDNLHWSGFVIPDFFSTSVDTAPVVSMVATDRIGTLKEISNNAESNIPIQILASCLKQTGQDLPINLIADNNHFETPIQLERIEDIASYDVIRTFMVLFNCKITLYKNAWWVINKKLLESGFVNYKSYNSNGVGGSVTPFAQPILDIDLVDRDGQREIKPTASEISLFLEFGGSKKYPNNWNFEKWNGTTFDNWTNYNGFSQGKRQTEIIFYTRIDGYYQAYLSEIETENKSLWYVARWYSNKLSDNILDYPNLKSSSVNVPKERGFIDIALNGNFTTRDGMPIWIVPLIHNKTNGNYFTYNKEGVILKIGSGTPNLNQSNFDYVHNPRASSQNGFNPDDMTHASVDVNWDIKNTFDLRDFGSDSDEIEMQVVFLGGIYLQGSLDYGTDVFLNAVNISFNDSQVTGKGLIFKVKQGGEKFSKSRDPETILFSDKINQGVNGYFYNYKYDDTSIVDLPSEFALSSVRERADMFSKARDYYSLDGNFIVNPLAKYVCGLKSFVLVGGENRREDASIIVEEIVSNTLNRTDFIYTYFDDGKDKVKSIGTASGGSSSSGGGGSSSSGGGGSSPSVPQLIKEDEEGNYYSEQPFYSLGGLSAYGFSEEGSETGGGIVNILPSWESYTSDKSGWALSAGLGKGLYDNKADKTDQRFTDARTPLAHTHVISDITGLQGALNSKTNQTFSDGLNTRLTSIEGGSATTINVSGTGDLLASVSKVGNNINFIKGNQSWGNLTGKPSTFAPSAHSHPISDITNLQTELNKKATNTALTTHVNKTDNPHSVTKSQVGLGNVANKDLSNVDNIQQATKTEFTSHKNLFDSMFRKVGTNIEAKLSLYSLGGLSAYGFSEEGSETGGGIVNILPSWESYTSDKSGWALSAGLGKGLYDNKADKTDQRFTDARTPLAHTHVISDITGLQGALNSKTNQTFSDGLNTRLTSIEGGSATTINVSGTGDLLASVSKVGNNINFIKGNQSWGNLTGKPSTFAPSAHSHPISDITNLQTELNKKATNTALTTHVNKTDNPHSVTKSQVGLGNVANKDLSNVDNIQQATKTEFTSHKNLFDSMFRKVGTNIEAKLSLYSLGGLSAYGFSEEGSETGGGIVNILPSWESYTSDKSGWALSAGLGVDLNTRKADKTWVESLLEDYVPTDTTYTAGRGLTLTGTQFSTSFDIANYATVTALDGKVDKKTGFSLISDTEIARLANVTNQDISGKADKSTSLAGYGITDAYTKTSVDTLLSGKENAFTKNSAFNKNFGTTVGTVAQGNDSRILNGQTAFGWGDFRDYGLGLGVSQTNYLEDVSNDKLSGFYWGNNITENAPFPYSTILYQRYGAGTNRYNALFLSSTVNRIVYRRHRDETTTDTEVWTDKNHRSNTENDTRYKEPFDTFKTTFDTMFRKTPTNEIEAKLSLYTLGGLSAYGFSDEGSSGGGGGIVNILSDWAIYDASKSGWALGAGLGKGLYDNKADKTDPRFTDARTPLSHTHIIADVTGLQTALNSKTNQTFSDGLNDRLTNVESGSATTVNTTGTGDLLASVSKVGNNINFIKGNQSWGNLSGKPSTFVPSAHSHPISDITNLQTALNNKLETSIFNTHNNDNIRHITGAERTKWDGVVTDFDNLEIGSRNYILHSLMMGGNNPTFGDDDRGRWYNVSQVVRDVTLRGVFKENTQYTLWYERGEIDSGRIRFIIRYTDGTNSGNIFTNVPFITPKDKTVSYVNITYGTTGRLEIINPTFVEGNKPMKSWTPAPEDQVSDWNTTDVNSFSFIKNKPTLLSQFTDNIGVATHIANKANPHSVTKAQIGLSNVDNAKQATKVEFDLFKSAFDEMFRKVGANIEAKLPLYSLGGLSAYGFSDEGSSSGGGIVNILPSWESYDTSKSGWALSAGLGENLRTRVVALENAEIDLSGYATLNYVNDKVKTNVPLNAKFTDTIVDISGKVDKKTGFSLISDTEITRLSNVTNQDLSSYAKTSDVNNLLGGKVDKVTGKSLISDTEITRLSSVTNQDLTPYALKTYVDTEVGKKWTYNETTIKAVKVSNAVRADNVGGFTVGVNVPSNAKFTDTIVDISGKVDKVTGKGLSTNDFTTVEKNKLAILENQTRESLGVDNVTNESKATMFTNPTFTGTTKVTILELDSNWKFVKVGDNIELQFDGVTKQIMTDNGDIIATAGVTAYE